ncbi:hypothetical protein AB9K32_05395 [Allomuricauda sp. XS_ASV26]|uniref:hypothetical protein n=1 Tax=Allomuricauda sp. XS_ASV26 TaxID=3241292 RepID=UPI00351610B0
MERKKRKRIPMIKGTLVVDKEAFVENCASQNAKPIHEYEEFKVELWVDKHYQDRSQFGDENGKREGIEVERVQDLMIRAFRYLLDIYLRGVNFKFINHFDPNKPDKPPIKVVLKEIQADGTLNVVVQIHYLEPGKFQITVITAMKVDDFRIADGQYAISLTSKEAILRRNVRKSMELIYKVRV